MKDAKGHGSDARGGGEGRVRGMPIAGHLYHTKTNDELHYIAKDASEAARAQRGMASEGKYLDQVNDASTVLGWRSRGGKDLSQSPAVDVAAQHGIGTSHLAPPTPIWNRPEGSSKNMVSNAALSGGATSTHNSQGHAWGSPEALKDFKVEHGGPRDHAAEQRGFNSMSRDIARLRRQGK
jgi:hypothetical protein